MVRTELSVVQKMTDIFIKMLSMTAVKLYFKGIFRYNFDIFTLFNKILKY